MDTAFFHYLAILPTFCGDVKAILTGAQILAILPNNKKREWVPHEIVAYPDRFFASARKLRKGGS
jgi:hypothetical protein